MAQVKKKASKKKLIKSKELIPTKSESREVTPMMMMQMAQTQGAPVEQMERLWALNEKVEAANALKAYTVAMSKFRAGCPSIVKTKQGHNSKYAGLAETIDQIKDLLSENGLSHSWRTSQKEGNIKVECIVTHILGHSESTSLVSPPETSGNKNSIQGIGSAVEYMKRYTFFAILGLSSADEDTDGNINNTKIVSYITETQVNKLDSKIRENKVDMQGFLSWMKKEMKIKSIETIPEKFYDYVDKKIDEAIKRNA